MSSPSTDPSPAPPVSDASWTRRVWRIACGVGVAYLIVLLLLMIFEESLIFFPSPYNQGPEWSPSGLNFEDVFFESEDGTRLHAWYCPAENPRAVVLFAHGNAGNLSGRAWFAGFMQREMNCSIMLFDYRGYGRSEGSPNEEGVLADGRAARRELAKLAGVTEEQIVLMGRSLGGSVAIDLAAHKPARALIVESTFTSVPDVAAVHYPMFPVRLIMRTQLNSIDKIDKHKGPLLHSHGDADEVIPYHLGEQLHEAANQPKQFFRISGGTHNDPNPPEYYQALDRFLDEL